MRVVDQLLEDEDLLEAVYEAQGKRHPHSRTRGRGQTPAEVALRMLILKHVRNWSYEVLEREVRANVVYRTFCRIGTEKVPDEKTLRLGQAIGPETIRELHDRIVGLAQQRRVIHGRKMRVDTTVVESNIHYPTDSGLLQDGARVLTRTMQQIEGKAGHLKKKGAQPDAYGEQTGDRHCPGLAPQKAGRRAEAHARIWATAAGNAANCQ
ncbi:MAG TPA: transposase [Terriglobales bacterium]